MSIYQIAVVGAGPAGLASAIALKALGFDVSVFEQAAQIEAVGSGVLLQSNGLRVLEALGVLPRLAPKLRFCSRMTLESAGRCIFSIPYGDLPVPHAHCAAVMRRDLLAALLQTARESGVPLFLNRKVVGVQTGDGAKKRGVCVSFLGENGGEEAHAFDAVIACDGVRSPVRTALGILRGVSPLPAPPWLRTTVPVCTKNNTVRELWGRDGRGFGVFPLLGGETHFFCSAPPRAEWEKLLDNPAALSDWVDSWVHFGPDIFQMVRAVPEWGRVHYGVPAVVQATTWHKNGVFLVGDAAHAMPPNLGQGANAALVDALVLARLLAETAPDWSAAGSKYQAVRRPFVRKTQQAAGGLGFWAKKTNRTTQMLRDALVRGSGTVSPMRRHITHVTVGYNPPENGYFAPLDSASCDTINP